LTTHFVKAKPVIHQLKKNGFEAYFVGGSVRDFVMGREINDIDIATSAMPEEVKSVFERTFDVGIKHGTILVLTGNEKYEVTTFRTESTYSDFRRPDSVKFVRSLLEDLNRRDFTMNALAMDENGKIFDYFEGIKDIENGIIRAVGNPVTRFQEDALRMLRAIRFQSQIGFQIEEDTLSAIKQNAKNLKHISQERITIEFEKILMGKSVRLALQTLFDSELIFYINGLEMVPISLLISNLDSLETIEEKWADFFIKSGIEPNKFLITWKCSSEKVQKVKAIVNCFHAIMESGWTNRNLFNYGLETALCVENLRIVRKYIRTDVNELFQKLVIKTKQELSVNGQDIMDWKNQKGGPWLSETIENIIEHVLNGKLKNEKKEIKSWILSNN
jgi:tRNA nucleotidyltransferase (CCA-adding enzyme)